MEQTLEMKIEGMFVIPLCGVNLETYKQLMAILKDLAANAI